MNGKVEKMENWINERINEGYRIRDIFPIRGFEAAFTVIMEINPVRWTQTDPNIQP